MIEHAAADGRFFYARAVGGFIRSWAAAFRHNTGQTVAGSVSALNLAPVAATLHRTPRVQGFLGHTGWAADAAGKAAVYPSVYPLA